MFQVYWPVLHDWRVVYFAATWLFVLLAAMYDYVLLCCAVLCRTSWLVCCVCVRCQAASNMSASLNLGGGEMTGLG